MTTTSAKPAIEVLARIDSGDRSLRVQRERVVEHDGEVRIRVSVASYVRLHGGRWARDRDVGVRRSELRAIIAGLTAAISSEPMANEKQGVLL